MARMMAIKERMAMAALMAAMSVMGVARADGLWMVRFAATVTDGANPTGAAITEGQIYGRLESIHCPKGETRQLTGRLTVPETGWYEWQMQCAASALVVIDGVKVYAKENGGSWNWVADGKRYYYEAGKSYPVFMQIGQSTFDNNYFGLKWRHAAAEADVESAEWEQIPVANLSRFGGDSAIVAKVASGETFGKWTLEDFNTYAEGESPTGAAYLQGPKGAFDLRLVGSGTDLTGINPADQTNGFVHFSQALAPNTDFIFEALIANPKQPYVNKTVDGKSCDAYDVVGVMVRGGSKKDSRHVGVFLMGGGNRKPFVSSRTEDGGAVLNSRNDSWVGDAPRPIRLKVVRVGRILTCYVDGEQVGIWDGKQSIKEFNVGGWPEIPLGFALSSYNFPKMGAAFIQDITLETKMRGLEIRIR